MTPWLERQLLALGEELVRVPPKLTVPDGGGGAREVGPDRRARGRQGGARSRTCRGRRRASRSTARSSCWSTTVTISSTRAANPGAAALASAPARPDLVVPLGRLDRASHLERVSRWLARRQQEVQVRIARELVARCRTLTRAIDELDQELEQRTPPSHRRCSSSQAAAASPPRSCSPRSARSAASKATRNSPATAASHHSKQAQAEPTPPARPRRQPTAERRALPDRNHTGPLPPSRARLPRTQTSRRENTPRSHPLPQTTPRPLRLQHPESEPRLDIGATLAQATAFCSSGRNGGCGFCS